MAAKTYLPGLQLILEAVQRYCTRYLATLNANMTPAQYSCLLAVIDAVGACLVSLTPHEIET